MTALLDFSSLSAFSRNALRVRENSFSDTVSRISSGLRLTGPADDVAAWMMSVRMNNRVRGWNQASQNIQNGLSLLATADAGIGSINQALERIRELAVESANGVSQDDHRAMIQNEVDSLRRYIYDTIGTTDFNGLKPLAGNSTFTPPTIDLSALNPTASSPSVGPATKTGVYDVNITQLARQGYVVGNQPTAPLNPLQPPTVLTITSDQGTVNVTLTSADPPATWPAIVNAAAGAIGVTAEITDNTTTYPGTSVAVDGPAALVDPANQGFLMFRTAGVGSASTIAVTSNQPFDTTGYNPTATFGQGTDVQGTIGNTDGIAPDGTAPFSAIGLTITAGPGSGGADGLTFTFDFQPVATGFAGTVDVTVPPVNVMAFTHVVQMAPDHLDEHVISIDAFTLGSLEDDATNPATLGGISLATQNDALAALDVIDAAIEQVNQARTSIGSQMEALEGELNNALGGAYTLDSQYGRLTGADMAAEATDLMQGQLAQQTGMAVLEAIRSQSTASLEFMVNMLGTSPLRSAA